MRRGQKKTSKTTLPSERRGLFKKRFDRADIVRDAWLTQPLPDTRKQLTPQDSRWRKYGGMERLSRSELLEPRLRITSEFPNDLPKISLWLPTTPSVRPTCPLTRRLSRSNHGITFPPVYQIEQNNLSFDAMLGDAREERAEKVLEDHNSRSQKRNGNPADGRIRTPYNIPAESEA
jgi:hypothetical protein